MALRGAANSSAYVIDIDYDAKGQRERVMYANGVTTTYGYDPLTFRLSQLRSTRASDSAVLQDLRYTYDPVGNITQIRDLAQQTIFFDNAVVSPDQVFEYDPLYRLSSTTGREHTSLGQTSDVQVSNVGPRPHPDEPAALRTFTNEPTPAQTSMPQPCYAPPGSGAHRRRRPRHPRSRGRRRGARPWAHVNVAATSGAEHGSDGVGGSEPPQILLERGRVRSVNASEVCFAEFPEPQA